MGVRAGVQRGIWISPLNSSQQECVCIILSCKKKKKKKNYQGTSLIKVQVLLAAKSFFKYKYFKGTSILSKLICFQLEYKSNTRQVHFQKTHIVCFFIPSLSSLLSKMADRRGRHHRASTIAITVFSKTSPLLQALFRYSLLHISPFLRNYSKFTLIIE